MVSREFIAFAVALAILACATLVAGLIVMLAWNAAMPHLFGLPQATFANGVGLSFLAAALRGPTLEKKSCR